MTRADEHQQRLSLAETIDRRQAEIVRRWLAELRADMDVRHVTSTDLRDSIGDYLARIADALRGPQAIYSEGTAAWSDIAQEHALTRVRQGFNVEALVRELTLVRRVIIDVLLEDEAAPLDAKSVVSIADVLSAAIGASVKAYVKSRDYAARRIEAEHVGFITHQLRNPLSSAMLSADQLRRGGRLGAADAGLLDILERNLRRLRDLIDEVLLAERMEAGEITPHPVEVAMAPLVEDLLPPYREAARRKGLELRSTVAPSLSIHADPKLVVAALESLLDNAVKYADSGAIELSVEEQPRELVVHVRDECVGLSPEELAIVFEPFRRGQSAVQGSGLGLAIARRAVEAQGGAIHAESPRERGCHFWFTLPRKIH